MQGEEEPSDGSEDPRRKSITRKAKNVSETLPLHSGDSRRVVGELSQVREDRNSESVVKHDSTGQTYASVANHEAPFPEFTDGLVESV